MLLPLLPGPGRGLGTVPGVDRAPAFAMSSLGQAPAPVGATSAVPASAALSAADGALADPGAPLEDPFGRKIRYLRISITDRCNLKCVYCTSQDGFDHLPRPELLTYEEILGIVSALVPVGLEKVRITGGEPLVRQDVGRLVRGLGRLGLRRIALSTNGVLLAPIVDELHAAGLDHLNISLDTQDPGRFRQVTRGGDVARVFAGIERALAIGVESVKINCVLLKDVNEDEVVAFARLALRWPVAVRFIELMPLDHCGLPHAAHYVSAADVLAKISRELGPLEPIPVEAGRLDDGPASYYRLAAHPRAPGKLGVITPQSNSFCARCNRVRLSANGQLKLCLFGDEFVDLRSVVRRPGSGAADVVAAVRESLPRKPKENAGYKDFAMQMIGG